MNDERRQDDETRARLDEMEEGTNKRLKGIEDGYLEAYRSNRSLILGFSHRVYAVLALLAVIQIGLGIWSLSLQSQNGDRVDDIQASRRESIILTCQEQNSRHDNTINALNGLIVLTKKSNPARAKRAEEGRAGTILLIEALVPKRNCKARARALTKTKPTLR